LDYPKRIVECFLGSSGVDLGVSTGLTRAASGGDVSAALLAAVVSGGGGLGSEIGCVTVGDVVAAACVTLLFGRSMLVFVGAVVFGSSFGEYPTNSCSPFHSPLKKARHPPDFGFEVAFEFASKFLAGTEVCDS
jgi:hypothetical protein